MKQALILLATLVAAFSLRAQTPVNDVFDCSTMVNLGEAPACQPTVYTNKNATPSLIATLDTVSCFQNTTAARDVWFRFQCPISLLDVRVTITGTGTSPIVNPEFAIYRGNCFFNGLVELHCVRSNQGQISTMLDLFGLSPGLDYYIRVSDWSATTTPNWGDFTVCVDSIPPIVNITQGGTSLCAGTLYDSGGEFGDYGPNEDHTFVICPDQQSECITFSLEYYNLEPTLDPFGSGQGDELSFFDGKTTSAALLASLDGTGFSQENITGGGGVCFNIQAKSGCLTVSFESDGSVQESGWKGSWQCNSDPCEPTLTMSIDTTDITADTIVAAISTGGAIVTVTDIRCDSTQYGIFKFATESNDLNMEKGLMLTSGRATNALGPNNLVNPGTVIQPLGDPGDADLNYLSNLFGSGSESHDACIIELDVLAQTNEVVFEYVFGSEEYPEYILSAQGYNDIFAFLVSGPGVVGDPNLTNSALNIAVLPNTNTPVQIDSVNNQFNWQYYRNNELSQSIQYDGLTSDFLGTKKSLTARVPVTPCNTYHLKLAIADRGDESFDSGVFLSNIKAGSPEVAIQFASGIDYFIESCSGANDTMFIKLLKAPTVATTFNISLGGTATLGLDYLLNIPNTITFLPGQTTLAFPIIPMGDMLVEGTETILFNISRNFGCGEVILKTLVAEIKDGVEVVVSGGDTLKVCKGDFLQLQATGATSYLWQPTSAVSNAYIANPVTSPTQSLWLSVTGTVGTCIDVDSVFVRVVAPGIAVTALTPTKICIGGSVELQAIVDPPGTPLMWFPSVGLDDPNSLAPVASPSFPVTYSATITLDGCVAQDFVTIDVDTLHFPVLIEDTVLCQNYPVQLANLLNTTTQYEWTPSDGLNDPNISGPIALADQTTIYTLVATSQNGACSQSASVTITIILADIDIFGEDLHLLCLGETDTLQATAIPSGSQITWSPPFFLNTASGSNVISSPTESITYTATYSVVNGNQTCVVYDSVHIKVDSLPDQAIRRVLDKSIYCQGDTIYLISNVYEPANFPGIEHTWLPHGTFLTPENLWNLVILATDTFTYQRVSQIGGCLDTADIYVPVFIPPTVSAVAAPPFICPGASSQITVTVVPNNPDYEYQWDPMTAGSLSCPDCLNPVASPVMTTLYQIGIKGLPCPAGTSVAVFVEQPPLLELAQNPVLCSTGSVVLNSSSQLDVTYTWTPSTFLDDPSSANPVSSATQNITYHVVAQGLNCSSEGDVTVKYYNASVNAGPDQIVCAGTDVTLTATTSGDPGTLIWIPGNQTTNIITVSPDTLSVYTVSLQYGESCSALDEVAVDVIPLPELNFNPNTSICQGQSVALTLPPNGPGAYQWSPSTGLNNPNIPNPIATPTDTITYSVSASNQNCAVQGSVTVYVASSNINVGADQTICFGETVTLSATVAGSPADSIIWMPGHRIGNSIQVSPVLTSTYTATLYFGVNCTDVDAVQVIVFQPIILDQIQAIPHPKDSICEGVVAKLSIDVIAGNVENFQWTANGVPIPGATLDSLDISPQGSTVTYTVIATDANGCTTESESLEYNTKRCFELPNAFTPNGDNANDTFRPVLVGGNAEVTKFLIFNRWGQKVFEATSGTKAWDGRTDGKEAPSDVYAYLMVVRFGNDEVREYHGEVTLLR
ncbi:MAG: choice-of-anchor L domain-containing protein [Saprospiraceae bacterium]